MQIPLVKHMSVNTLNEFTNHLKAFLNISQTCLSFKQAFVIPLSFCEWKRHLWISSLHLWIFLFLQTEF